MAVARVVLDSGALSALAEKDGLVRSILKEALANDVAAVVPSVVLAESTTGTNRDAPTNAVLKGIAVVAITEAVARQAGALRYKLRLARAGTIDALIVAAADEVAGSVVLTRDVRDLRRLAAVRGRTKVQPLR